MASREKVDIERIVTEYFMLKSVLDNKYSRDVISGKVEPVGPSAAADKKTLQAIQRYVRVLGDMPVNGKGLAKGLTLDQYLTKLSGEFKSAELKRKPSKRIDYSENPFEDNFRNYVQGMLNTDGAKSKIEKSLLGNQVVLDSVNSLVVNLGGKKQSSFIRLLAQSTDLFATLSGLEKRIVVLKAQRSANQEEIKELEKQLLAKTKEAESYKQLCEQAIEELGDNVGTRVLSSMLQQTSKNLAGVVTKKTNELKNHITSEVERGAGLVIDASHAKNNIRMYIFSHPEEFVTCHKVLRGEYLTGGYNEQCNMLEEIQVAAVKVGMKKNDPAVDEFYGDLAEKNMLHDPRLQQKAENKPKPVKRSRITGKLFLGILAGILVGGGAVAAVSYAHSPAPSDPPYVERYNKYVKAEALELQDFEIKLQKSVDDKTLVELPGYEYTFEEGTEYYTYDYLVELKNEYAKTDDSMFKEASSTRTMELELDNAVYKVSLNYLQEENDKLQDQIISLNSKIINLTVQIDNLTRSNGELQNIINSLQNDINNLRNLLANAQQQNSALSNQVNALQEALNLANEKINSLTNENNELRSEIAQLNNQISTLEGLINNLNIRISSLESENKTLSTEKASLYIQVSQLQSIIDELNQKIQSMSETELYKEKASLEQRVSELEKMLEEANARIASLTSENETLTQTIVNLENNISQLNTTIENLKQTITSLNSENADLQGQISNLQSELTTTINEYNNLLDQYNQLKNSQTMTPEQIQDLKDRLSEAYKIIESYENKILDLYNGLMRSGENKEASEALEEILKMFGISYEDKDALSNDGSEYQP